MTFILTMSKDEDAEPEFEMDDEMKEKLKEENKKIWEIRDKVGDSKSPKMRESSLNTATPIN